MDQGQEMQPGGIAHKKLGTLVLEHGFIDQNQLDKALAYQQTVGKPLGEVLLQLGILTEAQLLTVLAQQKSVEAWDLRENPPTPEALAMIPAETCVKRLLLPVKIHKSTITVAMLDPGDLGTVDMLYALTKHRIEPVQAIDSQLAHSLKAIFGDDPTLPQSFQSYVTQALAECGDRQRAERVLATIAEEETRPVIGMVNQIINDAVRMNASDIHIEPGEDTAELRYRVDGRLVKIRDIPSSLLRMVVARIKIMAELDIANNRIPQDGRVEIREDSCNLDLRVSVLPTLYGSRVVIRLLDHAVALKSLDQLGFNAHNSVLFCEMISKPFGMVLVTGPTGSGKTSTLYAAINSIKDVGTNIMTCEDPIEYDLPGVNQSQVNERAGLTFAAQLRAILRQDPDVVLVGEIRDHETAQTAIRAAMTGHLVLSTLHTNDAASAIPRLFDMGVEPFLLSTSLIGIAAQRLLRVLCNECKERRSVTDEDTVLFESLQVEPPAHLWKACGCDVCNKTGYRGRIAIHEIMPVTEAVADLIATRGTADAIRHVATEYGFVKMRYDAIERVASGVTTFEEARRVVAFDTYRRAACVSPLPLAS